MMEQDIYEALAEFRREFWRCCFFGLKFAGKLPPLSATHAARLEREAVAYYETGFHPTASLEAARNLRRETMAAIKTARLEFLATGGVEPKHAELKRLLRERDGDDCQVCDGDLGDFPHIGLRVPLSEGGEWRFDNLMLGHRDCIVKSSAPDAE